MSDLSPPSIEPSNSTGHPGCQAKLIVALAAITLFAVALRLPHLGLPLDRDEGEYAYAAWRLLEGGLPYRDAFDLKSPGIYGLYALALALFGHGVEAIRLLAAIFVAGTVLAVYALGRNRRPDCRHRAS